jgi:hypothetical protein
MSGRLLAALALAAAALAGCGGGGGGDAFELVIPDNNIRTEGVECSGARPFQHVRRGTAYRFEDGDGELLVSGTLPAGTARNSDPSIDWGVERIPTVCVMPFEAELPERERYRFVIDRSLPIEFTRETLEAADGPLLLTLSG